MSTSSIFSGSSRYSTDFQQIIDRAVAIASLPKAQMDNTKAALGGQDSALSSLDTKFEALQSALVNLGTATEAYTTSTSDGTVASVSVSSGATAGSYTVEVLDIGAYTSSMSLDGLGQVTDPAAENLSLSTVFTLTVDGEDFTITPAGGALNDLARAINQSGAGVEATVVNIGPPAAPDYRLSLAATKLGEVTIQLNDGSADLMDAGTPGTLASYRINGHPTEAIASDSRSVTVGPGLTVSLLKEGSTRIQVSHNTTPISTALSSMVSAYNAAVDEIDKHRGKSAGALEGSSLLYTLSASLRELVGYDAGSGAISSLVALGLTFDDKGKLSLDMTAFGEAADGQFAVLADFLGTSSTAGFLKHATDVMDGLENSTDGIITTAQSSLKDQIAWQGERITAEQQRIDELQQSLAARMSAADALIASLEQQVNYINGLFSSMQSMRDSMR